VGCAMPSLSTMRGKATPGDAMTIHLRARDSRLLVGASSGQNACAGAFGGRPFIFLKNNIVSEAAARTVVEDRYLCSAMLARMSKHSRADREAFKLRRTQVRINRDVPS
jgi:hypothetical protein